MTIVALDLDLPVTIEEKRNRIEYRSVFFAMALYTGEALSLPGMCFNRLTDYICYVWVMPVNQVTHYEIEEGEEGFDPWADIPDLTDDNFNVDDIYPEYFDYLRPSYGEFKQVLR